MEQTLEDMNMGHGLRRRKRRTSSHQSKLLLLFLTALAVFQVLPFVYMISTAFKPLDELFMFPPRFIVRRPTLQNFRDLLTATSGTWVPFTRYVFNSLFVTVLSVLLSVMTGSMAAYPLAMHKAPGTKFIFTLVVAALTFAPAVTSIPRYLLINRLGLVDTYVALIIPAIGGTYGVFLMKQFLESVPKEIIEAAKMDGANEWDIYWRVIMPTARPAWATLAIFAFIGAWNDSGSALVFTRSEAMKTLPLALQTIGSGAMVVARQGALAAASMLSTIPCIIVFMVMQRRVIETMVYSGIKS